MILGKYHKTKIPGKNEKLKNLKYSKNKYQVKNS